MVIPVYNQGEFVVGAIESVLAQAYAPIELIVVDDGSTDVTPERLQVFEASATILRQPNRGAAAALNRGIRASTGELVCWLSADDEFVEGKIEAQVAAFLDAPDLGLVHTGYDVIDAFGSRMETIAAPVSVHPDPFVTVFWKNSLNGSTVMLRREVFDASGGFDEALRADVDADMWLRIIQDHPILCVPGVFLRYRVHANTLSANLELMTATMTAVRRRYMGELVKRVAGGPIAPSVLLAQMSADFARQGLSDLAVDLLRESRAAGWATGPQLRAIAAIQISRARRHRFVRWLRAPLRRARNRRLAP